MAKYSYKWRTTKKHRSKMAGPRTLWAPFKLGKELEKAGYLTFVGKFKLTWDKTFGTILKQVK